MKRPKNYQEKLNGVLFQMYMGPNGLSKTYKQPYTQTVTFRFEIVDKGDDNDSSTWIYADNDTKEITHCMRLLLPWNLKGSMLAEKSVGIYFPRRNMGTVSRTRDVEYIDRQQLLTPERFIDWVKNVMVVYSDKFFN